MSHKHHPYGKYSIDLLKFLLTSILVLFMIILMGFIAIIGKTVIWVWCLIFRDHCSFYNHCKKCTGPKVSVEDLIKGRKF